MWPRRHPLCEFPNYPGAVSFDFGAAMLRDAPVHVTTAQSSLLEWPDEYACRTGVTPNCRRRFDAGEEEASSTGGCTPTGAPSRDHPTRRTSIYREAARAPLTSPVISSWSRSAVGETVASDRKTSWPTRRRMNWGTTCTVDTAAIQPQDLERNCNSNYLSVENYLHQVEGLLDANGVPVLDFSGSDTARYQREQPAREFGPSPCTVPAGHAPRIGVHQSLETTAAKKHCDGTPLSATELAENAAGRGFVRVNGTGAGVTTNAIPVPTVAAKIDWNGDLDLRNDAGIHSGRHFNGAIGSNAFASESAATPRGSNDWAAIKNIGLRQIGSGRSLAGFSYGFDPGGGFDPVAGSTQAADSIQAADSTRAAGSTRVADSTRAAGLIQAEVSTQTYEDATSVGHPPHTFKAVPGPAPKGSGSVVNLSWKKPLGDVVNYRVYRVDGPVVDATSFSKKTLVTQTPATSAVDDKVVKGKTYTYFATARQVDNTESGMSNSWTVTVPQKVCAV